MVWPLALGFIEVPTKYNVFSQDPKNIKVLNRGTKHNGFSEIPTKKNIKMLLVRGPQNLMLRRVIKI